MAIDKSEVKYVDLGAQWRDIRDQALPRIDSILSSGKYLDHELVDSLESRLARYLDVSYVISLNSGTDALLFSLLAAGVRPGDEVITVPNSYIATVAAIEHVGARTIFVDVDESHLMNLDKIESLITPRTTAIMPVHLEGKMVDMIRLKSLADKHGLIVIEDAAQSFGSSFENEMPGKHSNAACFSLHPLKNLNAAGDGGFIATNSSEINSKVRRLRNHGQITRNVSSEFGFVSRLDSIQAGLLDLKLDTFSEILSKRKETARFYSKSFKNTAIKTPITKKGSSHSFHLYVIEINMRDEVQTKLNERGIETKVHYPTLICDQDAFRTKYQNYIPEVPVAREQVSRILSLPIHQHLSQKQLEEVVIQVKRFA